LREHAVNRPSAPFAALGDSNAWLADQIADRVLEGLGRSRPHDKDRGPLVIQVAAYLLEHPDASANAVDAAVAGRRRDKLWAVRELRAASSRFLVSGNQPFQPEGDA
jgi:hypothetical protein